MTTFNSQTPTKLRVFAAHKLVTDKYSFTGDPILIAYGQAFDQAISKLNYYENKNYQNLTLKALRHFALIFKKQIPALSPNERQPYVYKAYQMINAFKKTSAYGLLRAKTRAVIIENTAMYAQPDFVDEKNQTIYEIKSYEYTNQPYIQYQLKLFQLAYPKYNVKLIGFKENPTIQSQEIIIKKINKKTTKQLLTDILTYSPKTTRQETIEEITSNRTTIFYQTNTNYTIQDNYTTPSALNQDFMDFTC